jgi:hypothetical protein
VYAAVWGGGGVDMKTEAVILEVQGHDVFLTILPVVIPMYLFSFATTIFFFKRKQ